MAFIFLSLSSRCCRPGTSYSGAYLISVRSCIVSLLFFLFLNNVIIILYIYSYLKPLFLFLFILYSLMIFLVRCSRGSVNNIVQLYLVFAPENISLHFLGSVLFFL